LIIHEKQVREMEKGKIKYMLIGFFTALILVYGVYAYKETFYKVYRVQRNISSQEGIILPKGVDILHKRSMPEGYDMYTIEIRLMGGDSYAALEEYKGKDKSMPFYWMGP
jgi:hypothetical protein